MNLLVGVATGALLAPGVVLSGTASPTAANECVHVGGSLDAFDTEACIDSPAEKTKATVSSYSPAGSEYLVTYEYIVACERGSGIAGDFLYGCGGQAVCGEDGELFQVFAISPDGTSDSLGMRCVEPAVALAQPPTPPQVTAPMVARAFRRIPLPESKLSIQPPGGETLVSLETVFSTAAEPFRRTVTLLGQQVELDIAPATFTWRHGDGSAQTTGGPGRAYGRGLPA